MAKKYEEFFSSEADGLKISVLTLVPEGEACRGIVQLVHGMSEHKERYLPFMEYLTEKGFVTVIHDHRGHGKSVRNKEDLGYMYGCGAQGMLLDIHMVNQRTRRRFPKLPLILFGHSMGSLAVRAYAAEHDDCIDMLIVCGSPSKNPARALGVGIARMEKLLFGARHESRLLEVLSFGSYAARFAKERDKNAWICSDKKVYKAYGESELCGFTFTDDAYLALFALMKKAYDIKRWHCTRKKMPVLFIAGAEDPCIGNVRRFAKAVQAMRSAGYVDVKGKLYQGMRHEILNETNRKQVYRDVAVYIGKKGF